MNVPKKYILFRILTYYWSLYLSNNEQVGWTLSWQKLYDIWGHNRFKLDSYTLHSLAKFSVSGVRTHGFMNLQPIHRRPVLDVTKLDKHLAKINLHKKHKLNSTEQWKLFWYMLKVLHFKLEESNYLKRQPV